MKKWFSSLGLIMVVALFMAGCDSSESGSKEATDDTTKSLTYPSEVSLWDSNDDGSFVFLFYPDAQAGEKVYMANLQFISAADSTDAAENFVMDISGYTIKDGDWLYVACAAGAKSSDSVEYTCSVHAIVDNVALPDAVLTETIYQTGEAKVGVQVSYCGIDNLNCAADGDDYRLEDPVTIAGQITM